MLAAAASAWLLTPRNESKSYLPLARIIPASFGDWHEIKTSDAVINPTTDHEAANPLGSLYDDVLMRAYQNSEGRVVLLAVAYGRHQSQESKIHRPELCYVAQGFRLLRQNPVSFPVRDSRNELVTGSRMLVESSARVEIVSYWIRIGDMYSGNAWATRYYLLKKGVAGQILDGILVRASQVVNDVRDSTVSSYELQEKFLADLVDAASPGADGLLIG